MPYRLAPASEKQVSSPGVEPGLRPSQGRVRIRHTPRTCCFRVPCRGIEPGHRPQVGPAVSRTAVLSGTLAGHQLSVSRPAKRTRAWTFGGSNAIRYTIGASLVSEPTTGFAPASSGLQNRRLSQSSHVGKHHAARARGVEPRATVLEAVCSPRSTLVWAWRRPGPSLPTRVGTDANVLT